MNYSENMLTEFKEIKNKKSKKSSKNISKHKKNEDIIDDVLSDEDLIEQFQKGSEYAYEQIVIRYKDKLLNFAYRYLGNIDDAEDVVQETFLKLYIHKNLYRRIARFSTWLYTITLNLVKNELNHRNRRKIFSINEMKYENEEYEISDENIGPEEITDNIIRDELIQRAINSLSSKFKEVVILKDVQELSYEEISKIINVNLGTIKSRLNRARLKLQILLKDFL